MIAWGTDLTQSSLPLEICRGSQNGMFDMDQEGVAEAPVKSAENDFIGSRTCLSLQRIKHGENVFVIGLLRQTSSAHRC